MSAENATPCLLAFVGIVFVTILFPSAVHGQSEYVPYYTVPYNMSATASGVDVNSTITAAIAQANIAASMSSGPAVFSVRPSGSSNGGGSRNSSRGSVGSTSTGGGSLLGSFPAVSVLPSDPDLPIFGVVNYTGPGSNSRVGIYDRFVTAGQAAFIWGTVLVTVSRAEEEDGINFLTFQSNLSYYAEQTNVPLPNADTMYGGGWLEVEPEPMILTLPKFTKDRYYSVSIWNAYGEVETVNGSRTNGVGPLKLVLVGPFWDKPIIDELSPHVIRCSTNSVLVNIRILVYNAPDVYTVRSLFSNTSLKGYSEYTTGKALATPREFVMPRGANNESEGVSRLAIIADSLKRNPPPKDGPNDRVLNFLKGIGVSSDTEFNPEGLTTPMVTGLGAAVTLTNLSVSLNLIRMSFNQSNMKDMWLCDRTLGHYGDRFLYRASLTFSGGIGALPKEEALYYVEGRETQFTALNGNGIYRLEHFSPPPVPPTGFWSLTVYNLTSLFLPQGLTKYNVGDRTPGLIYNSDETLDIYIQSTSPGPDLNANWLPTPPNTSILLVLRAYNPLNISYWPPGLTIIKSGN